MFGSPISTNILIVKQKLDVLPTFGKLGRYIVKILGSILLLFSTSAFAGYLEESDVALGTIMPSHHFSDYDYNETHQGLYLSINNWSVGRYTNSFNKSSTVITHNTEWYRNRAFVVKSIEGAATGYEEQKYGLRVLAEYLYVEARWPVDLQVRVIPDAVVFGIEFVLN